MPGSAAAAAALTLLTVTTSPPRGAGRVGGRLSLTHVSSSQMRASCNPGNVFPDLVTTPRSQDNMPGQFTPTWRHPLLYFPPFCVGGDGFERDLRVLFPFPCLWYLSYTSLFPSLPSNSSWEVLPSVYPPPLWGQMPKFLPLPSQPISSPLLLATLWFVQTSSSSSNEAVWGKTTFVWR